MALNATVTGRISNTVIRVNSVGGIITPAAGGSGVTLKNQVQEIRSIEDFADVVLTNPVDGATLVYNLSLDKYEVKPVDLGAGGVDGGTF
jgi:hypothetical protein